MLSLNLFISHTLRRRATAPGGLGGQCVDLIELYIAQCYGLPHVWHNASDWVGVTLPGWTWEPNTPTNVPPTGAIIVWGQTPQHGIGPFGHIAIVIEADQYLILTYDQNWPDGSPCLFNEHDYVGVLGWHIPPPS